MLVTNLWKEITADPEKHALYGTTMTKYLERMSKSNDQLVKLAAVLQRFLNGSGDESSSGDSVGSLTQSEKEELLKNVRAEVGQLKQTESEIEVDLVDLEKKSKK